VIRPLQDKFYATRSDPLSIPLDTLDRRHRERRNVSRGDAPPHEGNDNGARRWNPSGPEKRAGSESDSARLPTVTPYLVAEDGPALLEFAKQAFGAEEVFRAVGRGGPAREVRIGDSMLMMAAAFRARIPRYAEYHALHVYVEDSDAVYQKALRRARRQLASRAIRNMANVRKRERSCGNHWYIPRAKGENYKWEGAPTIQPYLHPLRAEPVINS